MGKVFYTFVREAFKLTDILMLIELDHLIINDQKPSIAHFLVELSLMAQQETNYYG